MARVMGTKQQKSAGATDAVVLPLEGVGRDTVGRWNAAASKRKTC